jgi:hypothetical protein
MDIGNLFENLTETFGEEIVLAVPTIIVTIIIIWIAIAYGQRRMRNLGTQWADVAAQNALEFVPNAVAIDYGTGIGTRSFSFPGMAGTYRGRQVGVETSTSTHSREAGRFVYEAQVEVKRNVPYMALAYKRNFEDSVKSRIAKDIRTQNRTVDNNFKVRADDPQNVVRLLEQVDIAKWLKQHKFRTGHMVLDGKRLAFMGAVNGFNSKPEVAMELFNLLCDFAESVERL